MPLIRQRKKIVGQAKIHRKILKPADISDNNTTEEPEIKNFGR